MGGMGRGRDRCVLILNLALQSAGGAGFPRCGPSDDANVIVLVLSLFYYGFKRDEKRRCSR